MTATTFEDLCRAEERFFAKVRQQGDCWLWGGARQAKGYGSFWTGERRPNGSPITTPAHRWAYEFLRTEIPDGLTIDHLCRNTSCVNPWHLEPVTRSVNSIRAGGWTKESCPEGHENNEKNVHVNARGERRCRPCHAAWSRKRNAEKKMEVAA